MTQPSDIEQLEKVISDLEYKFAIALIYSREDGDPKHRQQVIDEAKQKILGLLTNKAESE